MSHGRAADVSIFRWSPLGLSASPDDPKLLPEWQESYCRVLAAQVEDGCLFFFFFLINLFILFLAAFGLHCDSQASSSCGEQGLLFVALCGLLIAVASLFYFFIFIFLVIYFLTTLLGYNCFTMLC